MTAATFRVTWDDVPQIGGDFASVYAAMAHGQREYEYNAYDPMDDITHVTPTMSWRLGWAAPPDSDRTRLWLYDSDTRTAVHIDTVTVAPIDHLRVADRAAGGAGMNTKRPDPWMPAPDGFKFIGVVDPNWRVFVGKRCRYTVKGHGCGRPSVAEMLRPIGGWNRRWWAYCEDHLYGRWVEDDQVKGWRLVPDGAS